VCLWCGADGNNATARILTAASVGYITSDYAHLTESESVQAMTKEAWLACSDPLAMLCFLHRRGSGRKFRLFATACARDLLAHAADQDEETHHPVYGLAVAISEAEAFADGGDPPRNRGGLQVACQVCDVISDEDVAHSALGFDADVGLWTTPIEQIVPRMIRRYRTHPTHYLRDIFGAVFHEGAVSRACQPPTVLSLAEMAYQERQMPVGHLHPERLSVLADALEETGCTDAALLEHLRSPGPHVRGCWAIDLVLAKE
jgi:hypothetical protein